MEREQAVSVCLSLNYEFGPESRLSRSTLTRSALGEFKTVEYSRPLLIQLEIPRSGGPAMQHRALEKN